jgi:hypothetical protein
LIRLIRIVHGGDPEATSQGSGRMSETFALGLTPDTVRSATDHLMNDGQPSRLVVFVAVEREKTHAALIEFDSAGFPVSPGNKLSPALLELSEARKLSAAECRGEGMQIFFYPSPAKLPAKVVE